MPSSQFGPLVSSLRQLCSLCANSAFRGAGGLCLPSGGSGSRDTRSSFQRIGDKLARLTKESAIRECMFSHPSQRTRWMGHPVQYPM